MILKKSAFDLYFQTSVLGDDGLLGGMDVVEIFKLHNEKNKQKTRMRHRRKQN